MAVARGAACAPWPPDHPRARRKRALRTVGLQGCSTRARSITQVHRRSPKASAAAPQTPFRLWTVRWSAGWANAASVLPQPGGWIGRAQKPDRELERAQQHEQRLKFELECGSEDPVALGATDVRIATAQGSSNQQSLLIQRQGAELIWDDTHTATACFGLSHYPRSQKEKAQGLRRPATPCPLMC